MDTITTFHGEVVQFYLTEKEIKYYRQLSICLTNNRVNVFK